MKEYIGLFLMTVAILTILALTGCYMGEGLPGEEGDPGEQGLPGPPGPEGPGGTAPTLEHETLYTVEGEWVTIPGIGYWYAKAECIPGDVVISGGCMLDIQLDAARHMPALTTFGPVLDPDGWECVYYWPWEELPQAAIAAEVMCAEI